MIVAQIGCLHGEMDKMYDKLTQWEKSNDKKIDVVLCCGDFQSLRDEQDLGALKCPEKFKRLGGFAKYFSREKRAPFLTIFVGGNHEASNLLRELYFGGYVAENIFFLGYSSVVNVSKGPHTLRIAGISGIEKSHDATKGYIEEYPYVHQYKNLTSMYHIRQYEIAKLSSLTTPVDFMLSHEWPTLATSHSSYRNNAGFQQLLKYKPYFKKEIQRGELGSPMLSCLLENVQPRVLWCSAHLHCQYRIAMPVGDALVNFQSLDKPEGNKRFADVFKVEFDERANPTLVREGMGNLWSNHQTQQANNNVRPGNLNEYLQMQAKLEAAAATSQLNAEEEEETKEIVQEEQEAKQSDKVKLCHDKEWIAILQLAHEMMPLEYNSPKFNSPLLTKQAVQDKMASITQDLEIIFDSATTFNRNYTRVHPQTKIFIENFSLDDRLFQPRAKFGQQNQNDSMMSGQKRTFKDFSSKAAQNQTVEAPRMESVAAAQVSKDDNEIDLDDL